jgi:DNA-binding transcriptional ArsR family regulator
MSHILTRRVEVLHLPRGQKAVLKAVAWFVWDDSGETKCRTVCQIAARADYRARATSGHLDALRKAGAITCAGRVGDRKGLRYRIEPAWLDALSRGGETAGGAEPPLQNVQGCEPPPLQILQTESPTRVTEEEEEDARERARPTPPDENSVEAKEARRIEEVPPGPPEPPADRVPFPDEDPELTREEVAEIRAAGHDPAELVDEARDWANRQGATSSHWPRVIVHFARRTPPKRQRRAEGRAAAKPDRNMQLVAGWAAYRMRGEARP